MIKVNEVRSEGLALPSGVNRKLNLSFLLSGDFMIRNETIESKIVLYQWPRVHQLEFKIENHDDLLSYVQIDIIDTDVGQKLRAAGNVYLFIDFLLSCLINLGTT